MNDEKISNYKFYVSQLVSDFMTINFQIAVIYCK